MGMFKDISGSVTRYPNGVHQQEYDNATSLALEQNSRALLGIASYPTAQLKGQFGVLNETISSNTISNNTTSYNHATTYNSTTTHSNTQTAESTIGSNFTPNFTVLLSAREISTYENIHQLIAAGADPSQLLPSPQAILPSQHSVIIEVLSEGAGELSYIARDGHNTIASSGYQTSAFFYSYSTPEKGEEVAVEVSHPKVIIVSPVEPIISVVTAPPVVTNKPMPTVEPEKPKPEEPTPEPPVPQITTPIVTHISMDTGLSDSDGITSDNTLYFYGTADANCIVEVFVDGVSAGFTISNNKGQWVFDYTETVLPDSQYTITAQSTNAAAIKSPLSDDFPILIDTTGPELEPELWDILGANGNSAADGIIDDNALLFIGRAAPQAIIEIFIDGISLGTTVTDDSGYWSLDNTQNSLTNGQHILTLKSFDKAGNSIAMPYEVPFHVEAYDTKLALTNNNFLNDSFLVGEADLLTANYTNNEIADLHSAEQHTVDAPSQPQLLDLQDILPDHDLIEAELLASPTTELTNIEPANNLPIDASNDEHHSSEFLASNINSTTANLLENFEQNVMFG